MITVRRALVAIMIAVALSSCTWAGNQPDHPERKPFTVGVTEKFNRLDPAAGGVGLSDAMVLASFQRLLALDRNDGLLKPDAAECLFLDPLTFQCQLGVRLKFTDGNTVTAQAVRFSIERAIALDPSGRAQVLFAALQRIETGKDKRRIVFHLKRPDNQFGYALAAPVASIVSPAAYRRDRIRPASRLAVGSGPYQMEIITDRRIGFSAFPDYRGNATSTQQRLSVQRYDSGEYLRNAMNNREVDIVWGGLDGQQMAALEVQVEANPLGTTRDGFRQVTDPNGRAWVLVWSPRSALRADPELRGRVADAVSRLRTDRSLIPPDMSGYQPVFDDLPSPQTGPASRVTLGFDPLVPDEGVRAERVQAALGASGIEAMLRPNDRRSDLWLGDPEPQTNSAVAWLMPWLVAPLPESAVRAEAALKRYVASSDVETRAATLGELQRLSARDQTVLPLWRETRVTWMGPGISAADRAYLGPGGQLAVWGFRW